MHNCRPDNCLLSHFILNTAEMFIRHFNVTQYFKFTEKLSLFCSRPLEMRCARNHNSSYCLSVRPVIKLFDISNK